MQRGGKHPGRAGRARGQPFFGFLNFAVTHERGVFKPLGTMPHSPIHFLTQVMRWWMTDEPPAAVVSPAALVLPPYYPDTPVVRQDIARHYNNIAHMDWEVAALLAQLDATSRQWEIALNIDGVVNCCQAVSEDMLGCGSGSIINISSNSSLLGEAAANIIHYGGVKGFVNSFSKALAFEWAKKGVRVNTCCCR